MRTNRGLERKRLRDRARMRALAVVARGHENEHRRIYHAEREGSQQARWNRALGVIARRYDDEYRAALAAELAELGYESHPCSSQSPAATIGAENEVARACVNTPGLVNPWLEESTMDEGTRDLHLGEVR